MLGPWRPIKAYIFSSFRAHIATFLVDGMGFFAGTEKRQISPANYLWYQLATNQIVA
jgi:hypothetical protein